LIRRLHRATSRDAQRSSEADQPPRCITARRRLPTSPAGVNVKREKDLHRYFRILGQQKRCLSPSTGTSATGGRGLGGSDDITDPMVRDRGCISGRLRRFNLGKKPTIFGQFGQSHGSSRTRRWRHAARGDERSMSLTTVTCRMGGIGGARRGANVHFLKIDESFTRELLPVRGASGRAAGRERRKGISSVFWRIWRICRFYRS
jgi:hypothetical protein